MPQGPKGERRPADAIGVMIARIATGKIEDITTEDGKNAAAMALGRMGGKGAGSGYDRQAAQRDCQTGSGEAVAGLAGVDTTAHRRVADRVGGAFFAFRTSWHFSSFSIATT